MSNKSAQPRCQQNVTLADYFRVAFNLPPEVTLIIVSYIRCDSCNQPDTLTERYIDERCAKCQDNSRYFDCPSKCRARSTKKSRWCERCKRKCDDCHVKSIQYWCDRCYNKRCNVCRRKRNSCLCGILAATCAGCGPRMRDSVSSKLVYDLCVRDNQNRELVVHRFIEKFHDQWCAERFARRYLLRNLDILIEKKHRECGGYTPNRLYFRKSLPDK